MPECKLTCKPNSIAIAAPWLRVEYHSRNPLPFEEVTRASGRKVWWRCPKGHEWEAHPANRTTRKSGCPYCAGKRVSEVNSLATQAPWLRAEYHPKNLLPFDEVAFSSHKKAWWRCLSGHEWEAAPNRRTGNNSGCPFCSGNRVSEANSLATKAPWLRIEYQSRNHLPFEEVPYGSMIDVWWRCPNGHEWEARPNSRTAMKSGCPECAKLHSRAELAIFNAVKEKHPDAVSGQRGLLKSKGLELDVYIPSLKRAIEYDGTFWHSTPVRQEADRRKSEQCVQAGIQLLRIPEADYQADPPGATAKALEWLDTPSTTG